MGLFYGNVKKELGCIGKTLSLKGNTEGSPEFKGSRRDYTPSPLNY